MPDQEQFFPDPSSVISAVQTTVIKEVTHFAVEMFDKLQSTLEAAEELFEDNDFPPVLGSITLPNEDYPPANDVIWIRISELYKDKQLTLCNDQIGANDVIQGKLENCYFLSALSILADRKHYIPRLFNSKEVSKTGLYSLRLNDSGEWKNIVIDDHIPCKQFKKEIRPIFSRGSGNDIWVLLLEKAFAKMYGGYSTLVHGHSGQALSALTGATNKQFKLTDNGLEHIEQIWLFVSKNLKSNFVLTSSTKRIDDITEAKVEGVAASHSYSILEAQEVTLPGGRLERVFRMRNPWGKGEFVTEWDDQSPVWTSEMKERLNYEPTDDDGVFWVNLADFHKCFSSIYLCRVHSDFVNSSITLGENTKQNIFITTFKIETPGYYYISVNQKHMKHFRERPDYHLSQIKVYLLELDDNGQIVSFIHGKYKNKQSIVIKKDLTKGKYMLFIDADWMQDYYNKLVVTSYAKTEVDFHEEPLSNYDIPNLYGQILRSYILTSGDTIKVRAKQIPHGRKVQQAWRHRLGYKIGMSGSLLVNQEKDLELHFKGVVAHLQNMVAVNPEIAGQETFEIVVPPGEERIFVFKAVVNTCSVHGYQSSVDEQFVFVKK